MYVTSNIRTSRQIYVRHVKYVGHVKIRTSRQIYVRHVKYIRHVTFWQCASSAFYCASKPLAKQTRTSTQDNASWQNHNLRTDLRRAAKRIRKSAPKSINDQIAINLCRTAQLAKRWKTCVDFRANLSSIKDHANGWSTEKNCIDLGLRLARASI